MRQKFLTLLLVFVLVLALQASAHAQEITETERPLLMAHYMPWYQTPDVSGYWGWHWTMDHFNPDNVDADGNPEIASQYTPLTGAYDSQDPAVLEYQVLLMYLSGIDGVIADWYGTQSFRDYVVNNEATVALFEYIQRAGLSFTLCYEDATILHMVDGSYITGDETHERAQEDMLFAQENWFGYEHYLTYQGEPLLFVFGPQYFRQPTDWETIFTAIDSTPVLVTLDGHMDWAALAGYPWPPMNMAGGATLAPASLQAYLDLFYRNARRYDYVVGSAFAQFHDIYEEADVRSSFGYLDPANGDTLRMTIDAALAAEAGIIQLVTWNDYGEGTMIEPTEETGYQYLEIVQETRRTLDEANFSYTADDLQLPLRLFTLRRALADDADAQARLDEVFDLVIAGDLAGADAILAEFE